MKKATVSVGGFAGVALALLACSIDTREPSVGLGALMPEAGTGGGTGTGGTGPQAAPALGVEPPALDFGGAVVGSPARGRVSVVNQGNAALDAPSATLLPGSDPDYLVLHDQCSRSLEPGARCDVRIQLLPSKEGASAATLGVQGSGQSADVALGGSGLAPGPLTLAPAAGSSSDFGGVALAGSGERAFDVSNPTAEASGPLSLSVNEAQFRLLPPVDGDCQPGVTTLVDGQRCQVRVAFEPSRRGGADATLLVSSGLGSTALPLVGTGLVPASVRAPELVEFGGVVLGSIGLRTLLIENAGDGPLELGGVALAGGAGLSIADGGMLAAPAEPGLATAFSVQNSDCGAGKVLAGGDHCHVTVGFRPLTAEVNQQTALVVSAGGVAQNVGLTGNGLSQGALVLAASPDGSSSFGELAIGQSLTRRFVITNPSAQPSGALEIRTIDDFAVVPGSADGECQTGVTSLVNGESCTIAVTFSPSARGQRDGGLLASSVLAGAAFLPLAGQGLALPELGVARTELDFGRVPTETPVQQTLTVQNLGDQPLSAVQALLVGPDGGPADGFSLLGQCNGELTAAAPCELSLQFLPAQAAVYSAVLRLTSAAGGSTSALLLGRAFPRGSLVVAASEGSTDFGDVAIGSSRSLDFILTNPGSVPTGRLTLTSSSNAFAVAEGDCNPEGGAGLVNGSSCSFSVTFTPTASEALSVNLSVQSPGAGETALTLTGRGRTAPNLTATGNRDFGSASVGEDAVTDPLNQFTWTVSNQGDLDSGALQVLNSNPAEFLVTNDTCSNASVPGHGTCTMDIRFRPSATGARTANLAVSDTISAQTLRFVMTGNGIVIAGPGESCVNATCSSGVCTGGVCCDRACVGSCQVCSDTGVCTPQAERQSCGNGEGQCFGVDRCLLPERESCSGDDQCGSSNCERRLGGQGANDRICCLDDCGNTGQQCNPQNGRCQVPTLGAGAACGAPGQAACGAGLECKACFGGGSECTSPDACCGGCGPGYSCVGGECGCPAGSNGQPQIDCGGGVCALNRANACCTSAPPAGCNCDPSDNLCKECLQNSHCTDGPANSVGQCNANRSCSYTCQPGFKSCNGSCIPNAQCCGSCGAGQTCVNGQCLVADGGTCTAGVTACASGSCSSGRCCPAACGSGGCTAQGSCSCPDNQQFARGACRRINGQSCTTNDDCVNGCTAWFEDNDRDGFGDPDSRAGSFCGPQAPSLGVPIVTDNRDCCDLSGDARPGQTQFFRDRLPDQCPRAKAFDYDCDGVLRYIDNMRESVLFCTDPVDLSPPCAQRTGVSAGVFADLFGPVFAANGDAALCGNSSVTWSTCAAGAGECTLLQADLAPPCK